MGMTGQGETPKRSSKKLKLKLLIAFFIVMGAVNFLVIGVFLIAAFVPTRVGWTSALYEPIEDRSGRRQRREGCALNEAPRSAGCQRVRVTDIREEEVEFPSRLTDRGLPRLRGTLSLPVGEDLGQRPGIVLISGSGPNARDMPVPGDLLFTFDEPFAVFRELAHHLARLGFVVIRYDKRTYRGYRAEHRLDFSAFRFSDFADDARDALDFLASRPEVDGDALVVIGASQGGQFAPFVARGDDRVVAVVMLAGTTQTFDELLPEQLERQLQARERQMDYSPRINMLFISMPWDSCFEDIASGGFDPDEICFAGVTNQAWAEYLELERGTADVLRSLHCPVMAVQGTADVNIHPEEIPRLQGILGGRDAELHRIRDMGHTLTNTVDPPEPPELHPELLTRLDSFLASVRWTPSSSSPTAQVDEP